MILSTRTALPFFGSRLGAGAFLTGFVVERGRTKLICVLLPSTRFHEVQDKVDPRVTA